MKIAELRSALYGRLPHELSKFARRPLDYSDLDDSVLYLERGHREISLIVFNRKDSTSYYNFDGNDEWVHNRRLSITTTEKLAFSKDLMNIISDWIIASVEESVADKKLMQLIK